MTRGWSPHASPGAAPQQVILEKKLVWAVSAPSVWLQQAGSEDRLVVGNTRAVSAVPGLAGLAGGHRATEQT